LVNLDFRGAHPLSSTIFARTTSRNGNVYGRELHLSEESIRSERAGELRMQDLERDVNFRGPESSLLDSNYWLPRAPSHTPRIQEARRGSVSRPSVTRDGDSKNNGSTLGQLCLVAQGWSVGLENMTGLASGLSVD